MISKKDLLLHLDHCLKTEEEVIPLYAKHISTGFFLSSFTEEKQKEYKEL